MENEIGTQIRLLREKRSLTQAQLADRMNVSSQTISNWETGRKEPRMNYIEKLAAIFHVPKSAIIDGSATVDSETGPSHKPTFKDLGLPYKGVIPDELNDYYRAIVAKYAENNQLPKNDDISDRDG